jgi:UDP-N-acetylmuramyl pentapeptide phosphotransferase/UDP-N-acetylglucosamine-1-phosphate transferase
VSPRRLIASAFAAGAAYAATRGARRRLEIQPPGGPDRWVRVNHRGEPISLLAGPAFVLGSVAATALTPGGPARVRFAGLIAGVAAGALGAYDDLAERPDGAGAASKGLTGHLGALTRGQVTTGAVKVLGLAATGTLASAVLQPRPAGTSRVGQLVDVVIGGGVIAGAANLVNLLDLRPGRALKAALLPVPLLAATAAATPVGAVAGAAAALLPDDLGERSMLGDTGANAAGALLGVAAVAAGSRRTNLGLLAGLVALTLASERISFTTVIESTPGLRELDGLGRRPAGR